LSEDKSLAVSTAKSIDFSSSFVFIFFFRGIGINWSRERAVEREVKEVGKTGEEERSDKSDVLVLMESSVESHQTKSGSSVPSEVVAPVSGLKENQKKVGIVDSK